MIAMKRFHHINISLALLAALAVAPDMAAQDVGTRQSSSSSAIVRRRGADRKSEAEDPATRVTERMQRRFEDVPDVGDADRAWMRVIYRQLDLDKAPNTPLYYPVDVIDGEENLFRIIMRLLMNDQVKAYEYLDGSEIFNDKYRVSVRDLLDRCYIAYTEAKGSTEKSPKFMAEEADIPAGEVMRYYLIEKWEFDRRNNRLGRNIIAICPVLMRVNEYSSEPEPMPLFWVKYADIRPHLMTRSVFVSDDNNLPTGTYDDYFTLGRYEGDIYKTRNLRNLSMAQMYPDPDARKRAQDSIQTSLDSFERKLWVPSLDELASAREAAEAAADSVAAAENPEAAEKAKPSRSRSRTAKAAAKKSKNKPARKAKKEPKSKPKASSTAARSVRNRRK